MKKLISLAVICIMVIIFASSSVLATTQLNLATPDPADSPITLAAEEFSELVSEKTDGEVVVQVFPDGVLYAGGPTDAVNQLQEGSIDVLTNSTSLYPSFDERFSAVSIPFLFEDVDQLLAYLNGEPGDKLAEGLSEFNIEVLSYWPRDPRQLTSNRPVEELADFDGLTLRTPENPLWLEFFEAAGANPTPMDFAEVYNALQLETIDGQENPLGVPYSASFYEVQDYLTLTNHIMDAFVLGINQDSFASLSPENQNAVKEAAMETQDWMKDYNAEMADYYKAELENEGMEIIEPSPEFIEELQETASEIYPELEGEIGAEFLNYTLDWIDSN